MKTYKIIKPIPSGRKKFSIVESDIPGTLGGTTSSGTLYGRLDCPSALGWLAKGQYADSRVFFHSEDDAVASGFRPCARCLPDAYKRWKEATSPAN